MKQVDVDIDNFSDSTAPTEWPENCGRDRTPSDPELNRLFSLSDGRNINTSGTVINYHSTASLSSTLIGSEIAPTNTNTNETGETVYTLAILANKKHKQQPEPQEEGFIVGQSEHTEVLERTDNTNTDNTNTDNTRRQATTRGDNSKHNELYGLTGIQTEVERHEFPAREFSSPKGSGQEFIGTHTKNNYQIHSGKLALPTHIHNHWRSFISRVGIIASLGWTHLIKRPCKKVYVKLKASLLLESHTF